MCRPNYPVFDLIVESWDTANKPTEFSDFSVCTTWGVKAPLVYLLDVLRRRMDYPELKRAVRAQAEAYKATVVLIEDRASGVQLIQEGIAEGVHAIKRYVPQGDEQMRLYAQTATIENDFVYVPREAAWLAEYLHELSTFPNSKYDDQVDSTSQALDWIKRALRSSNVLKLQLPRAGPGEISCRTHGSCDRRGVSIAARTIAWAATGCRGAGRARRPDAASVC